PANRSCRGTMPGDASSMPITAVKTISDTTRGLVSATNEEIRDEDPVRDSEGTAKNFSMSAEAGELEQVLQVLDDARRIRGVGKSHQQMAHRIHEVDVAGR